MIRYFQCGWLERLLPVIGSLQATYDCLCAVHECAATHCAAAQVIAEYERLQDGDTATPGELKTDPTRAEVGGVVAAATCCRIASAISLAKVVGGPLDWALPISPVPQLNNRRFNMALGRVLGGGSSVNAMVWARGKERDYDAWESEGATGWGFKDVLPTFKARDY